MSYGSTHILIICTIVDELQWTYVSGFILNGLIIQYVLFLVALHSPITFVVLQQQQYMIYQNISMLTTPPTPPPMYTPVWLKIVTKVDWITALTEKIKKTPWTRYVGCIV